jgi:hypothetical protein
MVFLSFKGIVFAFHSVPSPMPELDMLCLEAEESSTEHVILFHGLRNYFCEISTYLPQLDLLHRLEITNVITLGST